MASFFVFGDIHLKRGETLRNQQICDAIIKAAKENPCDAIVCLGDTLDTFDRIDSSALCAASEMFHQLSAIAPTFILLGNHELPNNHETKHDIHPFIGLHAHPGIIVVNVPRFYMIKGLPFSFSPYYFPGRLKEFAYVDPRVKTSRCLFCHQEMRGSKMGAITSTEGDVWNDDDVFVCSGHIHEFSQLQPNILYVGASVQQGFGDSENRNAYLLHFTESSFTYTSVPLDVEKFLLFHLKVEDLPTFVVPAGKKVKVIVDVTPDLFYTLPETTLVKEIRKKCKLDFHSCLPSLIKEAIEFKRVKFLDLLYRESKGSPKEAEWFVKIFGNPEISL